MTDPVADNQSVSSLFRAFTLLTFHPSASSGIKTNLTNVRNLGNSWNSSTLQNVYANLTMNTTSANSGNLTGNRIYYSNDYAVSSPFVLGVFQSSDERRRNH